MSDKPTYLKKAPISIGAKPGRTAKKKYGGYPFALDFSLSVVTPSRLTVSFVGSEMGKDEAGKEVAAIYDMDQLEKDVKAAVSQQPETIYYCAKKFCGFPLKYTIKRSPSGDILTVDYYDASVGYLDNRFVLLTAKDIPRLEPSEDDFLPEFAYLEANPCPEHIWILGQEFTQTSAGVPLGNAECDVNAASTTSKTLYSNIDLQNQIRESEVPCRDLSLLSQMGGQDVTVYEDYHGTLRDVLRQWGERLGFSFYWAMDDNEEEFGELVFFRADEVTFTDVADTVEEVLAAKNLLDRTEGYAKDDTFNRAISAYYANEGLAGKPYSDKFLLIDFFGMPIMTCQTVNGNTDYDSEDYDSTEFSTATKQGDLPWYGLWDDPEYVQPPQGDEWKPVNPWYVTQFKRPSMENPDPQGNPGGLKEYRDYIRLVKAAALGPEFFKSYVFFKALADDDDHHKKITVEDMIEATGAVIDKSGELRNVKGKNPKSVVAFCLKLIQDGMELRDGAGNVMTGGDIEEKALGVMEDIQFGPGNVAIPGTLGGDLLNLIVNCGEPDVTGGADPGGARVNVADFVPVVANSALRKLISDANHGVDDLPRVLAPRANIRLCNGIVVGKDCLTAKIANPNYKAVQQLYKIALGKKDGGCQDTKNTLNIDAVDDEPRVKRLLSFKDAFNQDILIDGDNGTPYFISYVNRHGNSMLTDNASHNHVYNQLRTVADMAGRYWFSPELITQREFALRIYDNSDDSNIRWEPKHIDVADTAFSNTFQAFEPLAAAAGGAMPNDTYKTFMGMLQTQPYPQIMLSNTPQIDKNRDSFQVNILDGDSDTPCDRDNFSNPFESPNTARPNIEQWIDGLYFVTRPAMIHEDEVFGLCAQAWNVNGGGGDAHFRLNDDLLSTAVNLNMELEQNEEGNWSLKKKYTIDAGDFDGGVGYDALQFTQVPGRIVIDVMGATEISPPSTPRVIIESQGAAIGQITTLVFETVGEWESEDDSQPTLNVTFPPPDNDIRNVFGESTISASMDVMDSITRGNYNELQETRDNFCCCLDLDEGVQFKEKEENDFELPTTIQKHVGRITSATNLPIQNQVNATLVKDAALVGYQMSFSTNLIPIDELNGDLAPHAEDELDWIVDQVQMPGVFEENNFMVPMADTTSWDPRKGCKYGELVQYGKKGEKFEAVALGIPHPNGPDAPADTDADGVPLGNQAAVNPQNVLVNNEIQDCRGFTCWADDDAGVDARAMQIQFLTPNDRDVGAPQVCGELSEEDRLAAVSLIQRNIAQYVRQRAFCEKSLTSECTVTIPDIELEGYDGGIPTLSEGLESLSVRIDGQGVRVTLSVGTKRKSKVLNASNYEYWDVANPRTENVLRGDVAQN